MPWLNIAAAVAKTATACPTWTCVGSDAVTVDEKQVAADGLAAAADGAPSYACLSSICSPCMLLYMVRKPSGCLTEAGRDLMLPLDAPLRQCKCHDYMLQHTSSIDWHPVSAYLRRCKAHIFHPLAPYYCVNQLTAFIPTSHSPSYCCFLLGLGFYPVCSCEAVPMGNMFVDGQRVGHECRRYKLPHAECDTYKPPQQVRQEEYTYCLTAEQADHQQGEPNICMHLDVIIATQEEHCHSGQYLRAPS